VGVGGVWWEFSDMPLFEPTGFAAAASCDVRILSLVLLPVLTATPSSDLRCKSSRVEISRSKWPSSRYPFSCTLTREPLGRRGNTMMIPTEDSE
jgi:hypothetical protein